MAQESIRISKADLTKFTSDIFVATGLTREHADEWAKKKEKKHLLEK